MAAKFEALVDQVADRERVPRWIAQALVDTENPRRDPTLLIPEAWGGGSHGLTMITFATATKTLGFRGTSAQLLDPVTNLTYGLRYLRQMFDQVGRGDWGRARWAYNVGPDLNPPWPANDKTRFLAYVKKWGPIKGAMGEAPAAGPPASFQQPPATTAGAGGTWKPSPLLIVILGALLPWLLGMFRKGRR